MDSLIKSCLEANEILNLSKALVPFCVAGFLGNAALMGAAGTKQQVTVIPGSGDWTGDTGSYTLGTGSADSTVAQDSIKSNWTGVGDFVVQVTFTARTNGCVGVYDISEDATFASNNRGGMQSMTNSFYWAYDYGQTQVYKGPTAEGSFATIADGSVMVIRRVGSTITFEDDGSVIHTWAVGSTAEVRFVIASETGAADNFTSISFTS